MKWFEGFESLKDLHKKFIELAKKYHPDVGGDTETMKSINAEYDEAKASMSGKNNAYNAYEAEFEEREDYEFTSEFYNAWSEEPEDSDFEDYEFTKGFEMEDIETPHNALEFLKDLFVKKFRSKLAKEICKVYFGKASKERNSRVKTRRGSVWRSEKR